MSQFWPIRVIRNCSFIKESGEKKLIEGDPTFVYLFYNKMLIKCVSGIWGSLSKESKNEMKYLLTEKKKWEI